MKMQIDMANLISIFHFGVCQLEKNEGIFKNFLSWTGKTKKQNNGISMELR